jgi:predicted nucleic acid-binding protein
MVRLYLDACIINRLSDDQTQPRIRSEAAAITTIFDLVSVGQASWISSTALRFELAQNSNAEKREVALGINSFASEFIAQSDASFRTAAAFERDGFGPMDSLHLALAVEAGADWLLTVDDRFIRRATRTRIHSAPVVINPVDWLQRRKP